MNFDANTLSTLMQLLGSQKSGDSKGGSGNPNTSDSYNLSDNRSDAVYQSNGFANGNQAMPNSYNDIRYSARNTSSNSQGSYTQNAYAHNASVQSIFAMQNGLGTTTELFEKHEEKPKNTTNPMSSMFEMLTGKSSGGSGDMMSSLLPMFMNMMGAKGKPAQAAQASPNQSENKYDGMNKQNPTDKNKDRSENKKNEHANQNSEQRKTQPPRKDKFEPIAFAGYTLISALNKLYRYKRMY